jgi:transposase
VNRIVKRYLEEGSDQSKKRGGPRNIKLNEEHKNKIKESLKINSFFSLAKIQQMLNGEFEIVVNKSTIHRTIDKFSFSLKRLSLIPERRNMMQVLKKDIDMHCSFIQ